MIEVWVPVAAWVRSVRKRRCGVWLQCRRVRALYRGYTVAVATRGNRIVTQTNKKYQTPIVRASQGVGMKENAKADQYGRPVHGSGRRRRLRARTPALCADGR